MHSFGPNPRRILSALAAAFLMPALASAGSFAPVWPPTEKPVDTAPASPTDRFAQYRQVTPQGKPVSDHDYIRSTARSGEYRPFGELMRTAQARGRGEYIGVEPDLGRNLYRFKFLRSGGKVVWVDVDGRTGRVVSERD